MTVTPDALGRRPAPPRNFLTVPQLIRSHALRAAAAYHADNPDATDRTVMVTAEKFARFVETGQRGHRASE